MLQPIKLLATSPLVQTCAAALLLAAVQRAAPQLMAGNLRAALTDVAGLAAPLRTVWRYCLQQDHASASSAADTGQSVDDLSWHHWMS